MRTWIPFLATLLVCSPAFAGRIIFDTKTGEYGEYQSNATEGSLLENAKLAGLDTSTLEEKVVSTSEFEQIQKERTAKDVSDVLAEKEKALSPKREALKQKLGLTDDDLNVLREILN